MTRYFNIIIVVLAFAIGLGVNNFAMSDMPQKIAVVDINRVVGQSAQVMALKKEQAVKTEELQKWLNTARADVEKQKTQTGKEKLIQKYDEEFAKKQQSLRNDYTKKLQTIDNDISAVIKKEAKSKGYDIVLAKGVVLYGGEDITTSISKLIK